MEVNSPLRKRVDIPTYRSRLLDKAPLSSTPDDVTPISDAALFTERCSSSPNQLVTNEIQINPSIERAQLVDEKIPTPDGEYPTSVIV